MKPEQFVKIFLRDLEILSNEIKSFPQDKLWITRGGIFNSAGNLALHLCGNLLHFIGANLANSGYVRDRQREFSAKDIPFSEISLQIEECKIMIRDTLSYKAAEWLDGKYPALFNDEEKSNGEMLLILATHFNYHLGQINYLRRLISQHPEIDR